MGHRVILSPVIEMAGTGAKWPDGVVDAVLATSAHAFAPPLDGPSPEARRVMPLYLVGERTTEMARSKGFLGEASVEGSAALLVFALSKLVVRPHRIVYLTARDRKPDIETALKVIGQRVDIIEVYEARAVLRPSAEAEKALRQGTVDGVLHFSRRSAALFAAAAASADVEFRATAHFCLSSDVAVPLREVGCGKIYISEQPSEADLLALVGHVSRI